ncbi:MAG: hypothetical protein AMJ41_00760 [candidate division Zixibacteria bacterium DG_27]|nr:MAG: hypothetical protein AMJ41_00760 [candidate division Zixibacteria bacterium DG_27]
MPQGNVIETPSEKGVGNLLFQDLSHLEFLHSRYGAVNGQDIVTVFFIRPGPVHLPFEVLFVETLRYSVDFRLPDDDLLIHVPIDQVQTL